MNEPWPDDVFDCALRLAKSLGYKASHIWPIDGRIYVYCPKGRGDWRELDPRDPSVWGALIGPHDVNIVSSHVDMLTYTADWFARSRNGTAAKGKTIGLAVCEAYNALKGHPRSGK
jgi:hypothetical protein